MCPAAHPASRRIYRHLIIEKACVSCLQNYAGVELTEGSNTRRYDQDKSYFGDAVGFTATGEELELDEGCDTAADGDDAG